MKKELGLIAKRYLTYKILFILTAAIFCTVLASLTSWHTFAKHLTKVDSPPLYFGIPHSLNGLSTIFLIIIGGYWLRWLMIQPSPLKYNPKYFYELRIYKLLFIICIFIGLGSGYSHLIPNTSTLFWSYLPLSMAMMCLLSGLIADRINLKLGLHCCVPFVFIGMVTVFYWRITQIHGFEDPRWCILTTYAPLLMVLLIMVVSPHKKGGKYLVNASLCFMVSHGMSWVDNALYVLTKEMMTGYCLKHIYMGAAFFYIGLYIKQKQPYARKLSLSFNKSRDIYVSTLIPKKIAIHSLATLNRSYVASNVNKFDSKVSVRHF